MNGSAPFQSDGTYIPVGNRDTERKREWIPVEYAKGWTYILILVAYRYNPTSIKHCTKTQKQLYKKNKVQFALRKHFYNPKDQKTTQQSLKSFEQNHLGLKNFLGTLGKMYFSFLYFSAFAKVSYQAFIYDKSLTLK